MVLSLNFYENFYSVQALLALKEKTTSKEAVEPLKKIHFGKIILESLRLIPLSIQSYAFYHKDLSFIDDEARADCFSERKSIRHMTVIKPHKLTSLSDMSHLVISGRDSEDVEKALGFSWYYGELSQTFMETVIKLHSLAFDFRRLFPEITPAIYDSTCFVHNKKTLIRTVFKQLEQEAVKPEDDYYIRSFESYRSHVKSLIGLANKLFEANIAHGDLTYSNLVLAKEGGIKCLIDFDSACSLSIMQGRYVKAWACDVQEIISAMLFYQNPAGDKLPEVSLLTHIEVENRILFESLWDKLVDKAHELKDSLSHYRFIADTATLEPSELEEFLELTNPKKIFNVFET